jgi:hypothetical protein
MTAEHEQPGLKFHWRKRLAAHRNSPPLFRMALARFSSDFDCRTLNNGGQDVFANIASFPSVRMVDCILVIGRE